MGAIIRRISRVGLTVADLDAACAFYCALGFDEVGRTRREGPEFARLTRLEGAEADVATLRLGGQEIELLAFASPGRPYPADRSAADPWFQHFAIVVADMDRAYDACRRAGAEPISDGGPQLLPPSDGSIVAYKFRDPEGHPLELSYFPPEVAAPQWRDPAPGAVLLGIDHSAISVRDPDAAAAFYTGRLGLTLTARQVNSGPTQARLDGLAGAELDIVVVSPEGTGPHLELLGYRHPRPAATPLLLAPNDIAATRLILQADDLDAAVQEMVQGGAERVSDGVATLEDGGAAVLFRDPDGHLLELRS